MIKKVVLGTILLFSLLILLGCGDDDIVTGGAVGLKDVSTLTLTVKMENGTLMYGAKVYVNDEFKGETSEYGESKGTKTLVLQGKNNEIMVKKKGFVSAKAAVNAASSGEQSLTLVLEKIKGTYQVNVKDKNGPLAEARVSLYYGRNSSRVFKSDISDASGFVKFTKVEQGNYTLKVSKPEYQQTIVEETLEISDEDDLIERELTLLKIPELVVEVQEQEQPLPQAEVSLYLKEDYHSPNSYPLDTQRTDKEGKVTFKRLEEDQQYVIVAKKEGYVSESIETTLTPDNDEITLNLKVLE